MKRINFIGIIIILFLLINISLVIPGLELTDPEKLLLDGEGLEITGDKKIGDKIFSPVGEKGFVKVVQEGVFLTRNVEIKAGQNIKIKTGDVNTHVIFVEGDYTNFENSIQIVDKKGSNEVTIKGKKFNVKSNENDPPKFVLDDKGELAEGTKFETKKGEYNLRGYKMNLPEGSVVEYLNDRIVVSVPKGSEIETPVKDGEIKGVIEIKTKEIGFLKTPGGNLQGLNKISGGFVTKKTTLFYSFENKNMRVFVKEKYYSFLGANNDVDFSFINTRAGTDNPEMDLVFDENLNVNRASVLITKNKIGSISPKGSGAIISIQSGNRLGIKNLELGKKTLTIMGRDGQAILNRAKDGGNPLLQLDGKSIYAPNKKTIFGGGDGNYYWNPKPLIKNINHGEGAPYLEVIFGGKEFHFYANNENGYIAIEPSKLQSPLKYFVGDKGTIISSNAVFNELTPESRNQFINLATEDQKAFSDLNPEDIQTKLNNIIRQRNPISASVDLNGCSGTLVGMKGNKAYVLTAAHCVKKNGYRDVYLSIKDTKKSTWSTGKGMRGNVVAYSEMDVKSQDPNKLDLALLEIDTTPQQMQEIRARGFAKIAPSDFLKVGDKATMIGCTGGGTDFRISRCGITNNPQIIGTGTIETDVELQEGQSGGGLFRGRYLVGVGQLGPVKGDRDNFGGFGNVESIHKLIDDFKIDDNQDYSFLYKIILIFISK